MYLKVYTADTGVLKEQALYDRLMKLVPEYRRNMTADRKQPGSRAASLAAGLLLSLATERMGLPGADEYIKYGEYGKPYYDLAEYERALRPSRVPQVYFNISHSHDRVMCAVSDMEVGCDVEMIRPEVIRMALHMLHPDEIELFEKLTDEKERQRFFFRRWTAKESYVKAAGTGYTGIMPRSLHMKEEHFELSLHVDGEMPDSTATEKCDAVTETDKSLQERTGCATRDGQAVGRNTQAEVRNRLSAREALSRFYEWDMYDGYRYACCVSAPNEEAYSQLPDEEPELVEIDLADEF